MKKKMNCYNFKELIEDFIVFAYNKKEAKEKTKQALLDIKKYYVHIWLKGIKIE